MQRLPYVTFAKREIGEKIAAIEGLSLSPELAVLFQSFDAEKKTTSERLKAIHDHFSGSDQGQ